MLAIDDSRYREMADPAQLSPRIRAQDRRLESHSVTTGRLDEDLQFAADFRCAGDRLDERIPFAVRVEVEYGILD